MDPSGTINPAALNALNAGMFAQMASGLRRLSRRLDPHVFTENASANASDTAAPQNTTSIKQSPRGIKRSRSPEEYSDLIATGEIDAGMKSTSRLVGLDINANASLVRQTIRNRASEADLPRTKPPTVPRCQANNYNTCHLRLPYKRLRPKVRR